MQLVIAIDKVIAQGAGSAVFVDGSRVFREEDGEESLASEWLTKKKLND
jgi:hypothetical protein